MPKQPTPYEKELMQYLGLSSVSALEEFLRHPSWGCPTMQVPEPNEEEQAEDQWQEAQSI